MSGSRLSDDEGAAICLLILLAWAILVKFIQDGVPYVGKEWTAWQQQEPALKRHLYYCSLGAGILLLLQTYLRPL